MNQSRASSATCSSLPTLPHGNPQHDNVLAALRFQALSQLTSGVDTIVKSPHLAAE